MTLKREQKEAITLKEVGKYVFFLLISLSVGSCYNYFQKAGESANEIKTVNVRVDKEVELINKEFELSRTHREIQEGKITELESRTKKLQESRDSLSQFYVTRPEFNRVVEEQSKKLDRMDVKLDKIIENK